MSEKLSKQFKQGVFQFATGEHVPFGAEYLKSISTRDEYRDEKTQALIGVNEKNIHFFLCYAKENEDGILVPVDAPKQEKPGSENSFLE